VVVPGTVELCVVRARMVLEPVSMDMALSNQSLFTLYTDCWTKSVLKDFPFCKGTSLLDTSQPFLIYIGQNDSVVARSTSSSSIVFDS